MFDMALLEELNRFQKLERTLLELTLAKAKQERPAIVASLKEDGLHCEPQDSAYFDDLGDRVVMQYIEDWKCNPKNRSKKVRK